MCVEADDIRRPGRDRERAEGERPGSGPEKQRWEAVFRRERRPGSLDRFSKAGELCPLTLRSKGKTLFLRAVFSLQILMDQRSSYL